MMGMLGERSQKTLIGVHPDLAAIVRQAANALDFEILITEGLRTVARQKHLVATNKSWTMNSRHLTGHAVDICALIDGHDVWTKPHSYRIAEEMQRAADSHDVKILWGGTWKSGDTPHFQLDWKSYPKNDTAWKAPKDEVVAEKVKHHMANSSKAKAAATAQRSIEATGLMGVSYAAMKYGLGEANELVVMLAKLVANTGWVIVPAILGAAWAILGWMRNKQKEDIESGKYESSVPMEETP